MLAPPPPAEGDPSVELSFQVVSGIYEIAEAPEEEFVGLQYCPLPSANSVPPTLVTSGTAPGRSTDRPGFWESSQSAAPLSPEAANQVIPCALACSAICWNALASELGVSASHEP